MRGMEAGIAAGVTAGVGALGLWMMKPSSDPERKARMKPYEENLIAHRGLHDKSKGIPENSLAAFARAVEAGYGIELDVQLTKDLVPVIFHDANLLRMCGIDCPLCKFTYAELRSIPLLNTREWIPTLKEVLELVKGQVPMIVEIKYEWKCLETCRLASELLDAYQGEFCVESFSPLAVQWFRKNRESWIRGQLAENFMKNSSIFKVVSNFFLSNCMYNFASKPDFIAYNHAHENNFFVKLCKTIYHPEMAAWTIKNQADLEKAEKTFQIYIFDEFVPDKE